MINPVTPDSFNNKLENPSVAQTVDELENVHIIITIIFLCFLGRVIQASHVCIFPMVPSCIIRIKKILYPSNSIYTFFFYKKLDYW